MRRSPRPRADLERSGIDLQRREALVASGSVSGDELTQVINGASDAGPRSMRPAPPWRWRRHASIKRKVDLGRTVIRSPVDGVIARRQVQLGQRVQPSTPLLSVVPVEEMYVNANFKEVQLKKVRPGQKVELVVRSLWPQGRLPRRRGGIQRRHGRGLRPDSGAERDRQLDQGGAAPAGAHSVWIPRSWPPTRCGSDCRWTPRSTCAATRPHDSRNAISRSN